MDEASVCTHNKDSWITVDRNLKSDDQCRGITAKAFRNLGSVNRSVTNRGEDVVINLHQNLVRPVLEYGTKPWNPYLIKKKSLVGNYNYQDKLIELTQLGFDCLGRYTKI